MIHAKHLMVAVIVLAVAVMMPVSAQASLIGISVVASSTALDAHGDPTGSPNFGPVSSTVQIGGDPEFMFDEGFGINSADFNDAYDADNAPTGLEPLPIPLASLLLRYESKEGSVDFGAKRWTFGNIVWDVPGVLTDVVLRPVVNPVGNEAGKIAFVGSDGFAVDLPALSLEVGLSQQWIVDILARHEGGQAPVPGTLFLLGAGLLGLSRVRRRR